jgi:hypothetical protein
MVEQPKSDIEIGDLKRLLVEGRKLNAIPDHFFSKNPKRAKIIVPIGTLKEKWTETVIETISELLPHTIIEDDFSEIEIIYKDLKNKRILVLDESFSKTFVVLESVFRFFQWIVSFDDNLLDYNQKASFWFVSLRVMVQYISKNLMPLLIGKEDGRTQNTALLHLYGRIYLLTNSIVKLNDFTHCQLLTASLRSLLELYIDALLIKKGIIAEGIEKFFLFSQVSRCRTAKILIDIDKKLNRPQDESSVLKQWLPLSPEIEEKKNKLWGGVAKPTHWTGMNLIDRVKKVDALKLYRDVYYYGNMFVHSGYIDNQKSEEEAHVSCAYVYSFSLKMLKEATELILDIADSTPKCN